MKKEREKIKDTRLGKFLLGKAPALAHAVGDLLPDAGLTGVIKRGIDLLPEPLTVEESRELERMLHDMEVEFYKLEVADRVSAREREANMVKYGAKDWLFNLTGIVGLGAFVAIISAIIFLPEVQNESMFNHLIGMVEGVALTIFAYYFGTSAKRGDKN